MTEMKVKKWQLEQRQSLPLEVKIKLSKRRIREFYKRMNGDVYVAFSGGKDSTVLLDLVRSVYPDVPAVFIDTGLEYPENREFIKTKDNVTWLKPEMSFYEVLQKYGYPVVSKVVSMAINHYRNTDDPLQKEYRMYGTKNGEYVGKAGVIPKKWHYLIDGPFKISEKCCNVMKKKPFHKYNKETNRNPFIGIMAEESNQRTRQYMKYGCNQYDKKNPQSLPMSFWLEKDVWNYIKKKDIKYSKIYDMGEKRTGCMFCMFGIHMEDEPNRFQRMAKTHPNLHKYCMENLGLKDILDYIGVRWKPIHTLYEWDDRDVDE